MRVLIVRVGAMGDVLHGVPAVAALRRLRPTWRIDWAIEPSWWEMLVPQPALQPPSHRSPGEHDAPDTIGPGPVVNAAIAIRARAWKRQGLSRGTLRDVLHLRRRLQATHYDLCIDLQGSLRSALIGWLSGARAVIGPSQPREKPARRFYTHPVPTASVHVVDQACELVRAALGEPVAAAPVELPIDPAAEAWCDALEHRLHAQNHPPPPAARFVVLAPIAGWGAKEWPLESFIELARRLAAQGLFVLVNAETRRSGSSKPHTLERAAGAGVHAVESTIAQLTALLRRASLFVGGDTGPMHLADALGIPVVALFGPTDPARTGPRGPRCRILRDPASATDHRRHPHPEPGLARISVDTVMQAAMELLNPSEASTR